MMRASSFACLLTKFFVEIFEGSPEKREKNSQARRDDDKAGRVGALHKRTYRIRFYVSVHDF